jgi:hypothetical protein
MPSMSKPGSERYSSRQLIVLILATTSPFYWWPMRVSLFVQRPLLDRFAWHAYAEAPMLHPPGTPRMVGAFVVTQVRADPNGVSIRVLGTRGGLNFRPRGSRTPSWLRSADVPWFMRWSIPPESGRWFVRSMRYRDYFD